MKLINAIKNYPYKLVTAGFLLMFSTVASKIFDVGWLQYVSVITFVGLSVWIIIKILSALENEFRYSKNKTRAVVLSVIVVVFFNILAYLIIKFIVQ